MRITVLMENTKIREDLTCEHGLSLYVETLGKKILFDTGSSGAFADNAEALGIDLKQVDLAILSHGHYDHSGGLSRFLQINTTAPVYLSPHAFGSHYNAAKKYIGIDAALADSSRLIFAEDTQSLAPGLTLHSCRNRSCRYPAETWGLCRKEDGGFVPEDFRHEQYLLAEEGGKRICISGCSHRGILNIMDWFQPHVLVGGFHFVKLPPDSPALDFAAKELAAYPAVYYTGHCTGAQQFTHLKTILEDRLKPLSTGGTITI